MSKFIGAQYDEGANEVNARHASFGPKLPASRFRGITERALAGPSSNAARQFSLLVTARAPQCFAR